MSPRTRPSLLLLATAGTAVFAGFGAWWAVRDVPVNAGVEPLAMQHTQSAEPGALALANVSTRETRSSSLPAEPDGVPCLEDGHVSISGLVVDHDGIPAVGASVVVLGAPHAADAIQERGFTRTDEYGRFDVRSATVGDVWVVAFAPGARPVTYACATEAGFVDLAQPLRLERGVSITGRVSADETPLARVELEAFGPRSSRRVRVGDHELASIDGRIEWAVTRCMTDADGHWALHGLAPGRWTVRPRAFRCPGAVFPPGALPPESIDAPAQDVELRIPAARLAVTVTLDGEPLAWAEVEVEYQGMRSSRRADARGRLEVDVSPNEGLAVVVRAPGREPARQVVAGPVRGQRREVEINAGPPTPAQVTPRAPAASGTAFRPGT